MEEHIDLPALPTGQAGGRQDPPSGKDVIEAIAREDAHMKPRWHFVLHGVLLGLGATFVAFLLLYFVSFLAFEWRTAEFWSAPDLALRRCAFFATFPWIPVLLIVVLAVGLEFLIRRNPSVYRRPLVYSIAAIAVVGVLGGFLISRTPFHHKVSRYATDRRIFLVERGYRAYPGRFRVPPGCLPRMMPPALPPR